MKLLTGLVLLLLTGCAMRLPLEIPRKAGATNPEVVRFVVHPAVINKGETVMLHWDARNAPEVVLEEAVDPHATRPADFHELGKFPASGTLEVRPQVSTIYVVSCGNETIGCSSASVRVHVR
ncbi:MAG: hypothetical protein LAP38_24310 [Acidobacteriia bacterium]|nr:hypothetical protein [Terriglobia bacterium]